MGRQQHRILEDIVPAACFVTDIKLDFFFTNSWELPDVEQGDYLVVKFGGWVVESHTLLWSMIFLGHGCKALL